MCELQMLYTYVTFRWLFETQVLCCVSCFWALCKNGLQICELQMLYTYVTFSCLFETQVLCGVSCFWAPCKNGLQMCGCQLLGCRVARAWLANRGHLGVTCLEKHIAKRLAHTLLHSCLDIHKQPFWQWQWCWWW